jgi:Family of unknown function (DUF5706)
MSDAEELARRLLSEAREEVARADAKATTLLAGVGVAVGAVLAGLLSGGGVSLTTLDRRAQLFSWPAIGAVLIGLGLLVAAVTPRTGVGQGSPVHYFGDASAFEDIESLEDGIISTAKSGLLRRDVAQLLATSKIVASKYSQIRWAIWIISVGMLAAITAGSVQIATR